METTELLHIQSLIKDLSDKIESLSQSKNVQPEEFSSPELNELAIALAKAQSQMDTAELNKTNPYFKSRYADLKSVIQASRPALTSNGLSVIQQIIHVDDGQWLETTLLHVSGQWIQSKTRILPPKNDIQTISSYVTYLKRMCYASLVGVVTGDEDDDGETAVATSRETFAKGVALNTKYNPKEEVAEVVNKAELDEMIYELQEYPDIAEMVLDGLKIQSLADVPKNKYRASIERIRSIKNARNNSK